MHHTKLALAVSENLLNPGYCQKSSSMSLAVSYTLKGEGHVSCRSAAASIYMAIILVILLNYLLAPHTPNSRGHRRVAPGEG
ncbi:hypothetical protein HZ326_26296 [Fusarium oxysporum f. sp. albedinis]|nr:hypothetical protein HZ326_26296 [Fusarium oxysporum f. sp. albedinis]